MAAARVLPEELVAETGTAPTMRYGMVIDVSDPLPELIDQVRQMADVGLTSAVATNVTGYPDALMVLALAGYHVPDIELVSGVVPIFPHHPIWLASQALTVQAATAGRLTLGIGVSHKFVAEGVYGVSFDRPVHRMHEYLEVLLPLLRREQVAHEGDTLKVVTRQPLDVDAPAPPVLVAALGTRMLELAGRYATGTITWMTGPETLASHITPSVRAAAEAAGRDAPRIFMILPVCVTDARASAYDEAARAFGIYNMMPSYRAMLDREGASGPADVALIGDEGEVADQLSRIAAGGATDLAAVVFGSPAERERTLAFLGEKARTTAIDPTTTGGDSAR